MLILQALYWLTQQEHPKLPQNKGDPPVQLIGRLKSGKYFNFATSDLYQDPPVLACVAEAGLRN